MVTLCASINWLEIYNWSVNFTIKIYNFMFSGESKKLHYLRFTVSSPGARLDTTQRDGLVLDRLISGMCLHQQAVRGHSQAGGLGWFDLNFFLLKKQKGFFLKIVFILNYTEQKNKDNTFVLPAQQSWGPHGWGCLQPTLCSCPSLSELQEQQDQWTNRSHCWW